MKKLLSFFLVSMSIVAFADDANDSGAYINLNTGWASMQALPTGGWTGNINAGYNFNKAFAVEGGYNVFASTQYSTASAATNIIDVAAKGILPLGDIFSLYGRLGLGLGFDSWSGTAPTGCPICSASSTSYALGLAGVGASFALDKHFDLRIEDTMYIPFASTMNGSTINAITGGVQYNF